MSATPYMQLYVADYLGDTQHLTAEQHGAYLLLLMAMWRAGGALPNDQVKLARIARVDRRRWAQVGPDVMAYFDVEGECITQARLKREHEKAVSISGKRSAAGKAGGKAKALNNNEQALANEQQVPPHRAPVPETTIERIEEPNGSLSETSSDQPPSRRKRIQYPPDFEAFWRGYPTDALMSKKQAGRVWSRMTGDERQSATNSLPAFRAYCSSKPDYRPVHAVRYLEQERYVGFSETASKAAGKVFVAKGTQQWEAWQRLKKTPCVTSSEHRTDGWWFESEWPESGRVAA